MATVDLDARRAARDEARQAPHEVRLGGEAFSFPATLPLEALDLVRTGQYRLAFFLILGSDAEVARFFAHRPDDGDLDEILGLYGRERAPESEGSQPSSKSNGSRSKPTSPATTT